MANRFGEEYREQHKGDNALRAIFGYPTMRRTTPGDVSPQFRPDDKGWFNEGPEKPSGGSKVPRKPKPNTPSGGLKKPTPTKASK